MMFNETFLDPGLVIEVATVVAQSADIDSDVANVLSTPESLQMPVMMKLNSPDVRLFTLEEDSIRLFRANVRWALSVPAFRALSRDTQVAILNLRWTDLMVLGLVMFSTELALAEVLPQIMELMEKTDELHMDQEISGIMTPPTNGTSHKDSNDKEECNKTVERLRAMLDSLLRVTKAFNSLLVSDPEYAHLRAMCLFSPVGVAKELEQQLGQLHFQVLRSLRRLCHSDEIRMVSLLVKLPFVKKFPAHDLKTALKLHKCETLEVMLDQERSNGVEKTSI